MNNLKQLVCPISNEHVNERVTRINALFAVLLITSGFLFATPFFVVFLMADFYIRAFTKLKYSPLSYVSYKMVTTFQLDRKVIDKAPKVFAARLGFLMTFVVLVFILLGFNAAAIIIGGLLIFFASLEFALGVCMGCIIYTYLLLPFYK